AERAARGVGHGQAEVAVGQVRREGDRAPERLLGLVAVALLQAVLALRGQREAQRVEVQDVALDAEPADLRERSACVLHIARALGLQVGGPERLESGARGLGSAQVHGLLGAGGTREGRDGQEQERREDLHAPLALALATYSMRSSNSRLSSTSSSAGVR